MKFGKTIEWTFFQHFFFKKNLQDPCTDFFEFACGDFHKKTIIPDHQTYTGFFSNNVSNFMWHNIYFKNNEKYVKLQQFVNSTKVFGVSFSFWISMIILIY